ncbi:MAG TPA: hypothetical protein VFI02_21705, partial [Armatimonadota bacterium]|nr:hypothetical protein [Armatimonadota bacterium]
VEMRFGQAILGVDLGELGESEVVHKLDALLDRDFQFPTRPDDRIEQVAVRQLRLSVKGRRQWITLDVGSDSPQGAIYDLLDDVLSEPNFSPSAVRVDRARLKVTFRPDESGKPRNRTFTISHPDSHTLKNDPNDEIIKSCLKRWKLDVSGSDESGAPKPGEPAQYRLWR